MSTYVMIASGIGVLLGLILTLRNLYPRRTGDTPFCRKCGYNLTGLPSGTCPECGADTTKRRGVLVGRRIRRRGRILAGILLLTGSGAALGMQVYSATYGLDWYKYYPNSYLVHEMRTAPAPRSKLATNELERRLIAGELSDAARIDLIDKCLKVHSSFAPPALPDVRGVYPDYGDGRDVYAYSLSFDDHDPAFDPSWSPPAAPPVGTHVWRLLATAYRCRGLLPEQEEQFLNQLALLEFEARDVVELGMGIPVRRACYARLPVNGGIFQLRIKWGPLLLDGKPVERMPWCCGAEQTTPVNSPGRHEVSTEFTASIYEAKAPHEPIHVIHRHPRCTVAVVPSGSKECLRLVDRPELRSEMISKLKTARVEAYLTHGGALWKLDGTIPNLPMGAAFSVTVLDGDILLGQHTAASSTAAGHWGYGCFPVRHFSGSAFGAPPARVTLVFTPSPAFAKHTVGLKEIWGTPLTIENVPVVIHQAGSCFADVSNEELIRRATTWPDLQCQVVVSELVDRAIRGGLSDEQTLWVGDLLLTPRWVDVERWSHQFACEALIALYQHGCLHKSQEQRLVTAMAGLYSWAEPTDDRRGVNIQFDRRRRLPYRGSIPETTLDVYCDGSRIGEVFLYWPEPWYPPFYRDSGTRRLPVPELTDGDHVLDLRLKTSLRRVSVPGVTPTGRMQGEALGGPIEIERLYRIDLKVPRIRQAGSSMAYLVEGEE